GQVVVFITSCVSDRHLYGLFGCREKSKPLWGLGPYDMLQMHSFASAEERAIKDGMDGDGLVAHPVLIRKLEPPRLDAVIPTGMNKTEIVCGLCGYQEPVGHAGEGSRLGIIMRGNPLAAAAGRKILARRQGADVSDSLPIGISLPQDLAIAVLCGDSCL